ncbi:hypothetical protein ABZ402_19750 [Streptomyces mirabilis]|uniref:hypothetical protein n=1 Tax=Streptomyces mirabilis TaxID=68239 RepID=UPI0033DC1DD6
MSVGTYYPGQGTLIEEKYLEGIAEGEAKGEATLILRVLEKHAVEIPEDVRERITSCTDLDTLTLWFDRSLTATTAEELFTEDPEDTADRT